MYFVREYPCVHSNCIYIPLSFHYLLPHDLSHSWISLPSCAYSCSSPDPPFGSRAPQVGDQVLEVNGRSFLGIPHDEAVRVLKSSRHLMMTVKDVGRLPHTRTVVGETKWIASSQITESSASSSVAG